MQCKSYFEDNETQNYLAFQPVFRYFKRIGNSNHISEWKSKGLSDEIINLPAASNNSLSPAINHINTNLRAKFDGSWLKQLIWC